VFERGKKKTNKGGDTPHHTSLGLIWLTRKKKKKRYSGKGEEKKIKGAEEGGEQHRFENRQKRGKTFPQIDEDRLW